MKKIPLIFISVLLFVTACETNKDELDPDRVKVTSIYFEWYASRMELGQSYSYKVQVRPVDATIKDIIWNSSDESVLTVDTTGTVSAVGIGSAIITATSVDGGRTAKCETEVIVRPTGVEVYPQSCSILVGETMQLSVKITPPNATEKGLAFRSLNANIAIVDGNGLITAISAGTTIIKVTTNDGGYSARLTLQVKEK